jgi:hypothetical protein
MRRMGMERNGIGNEGKGRKKNRSEEDRSIVYVCIIYNIIIVIIIYNKQITSITQTLQHHKTPQKLNTYIIKDNTRTNTPIHITTTHLNHPLR